MDEDYLLFDWNNIPGEDSSKLIDHLQKCFKIDWLEQAEIEKSGDGQKITLTDGKKLSNLNLKR